MDERLADLKGLRLRIFCYLLQEGQVGVRQVQRALNLKSASHAAYHLTKLYETDIVNKTPDNRYKLKEEFQQKSVKINVMTEYYLLVGKFWPRTVFYSTYLVISLIIGLSLVFIDNLTVLRIYLILSLGLALAVSIYEVMHQLRALPWEEDDG
ncbi:MAG: hypothetical protein ACXAE3_13070 [Candidatus Kariarchaeaceae archaeon]|jgi:DNA-binding transcriptional ArsR family regulator